MSPDKEGVRGTHSVRKAHPPPSTRGIISQHQETAAILTVLRRFYHYSSRAVSLERQLIYGRSPRPETHGTGTVGGKEGEARSQYNGSDHNGVNTEMAWGAVSVDVGHSWGDGAGRSMSANLNQVAATVSSASALLGEAAQKVFQLLKETGKKVEEVTSELGVLKEELREHQEENEALKEELKERQEASETLREELREHREASEVTIASLRTSQQESEEEIESLKASLTACKAQKILQEDHLGQLETWVMELTQKD